MVFQVGGKKIQGGSKGSIAARRIKTSTVNKLLLLWLLLLLLNDINDDCIEFLCFILTVALWLLHGQISIVDFTGARLSR